MFERSFHFIPAHRTDLFDRIPGLWADAYVIDLEDAVPGAEKAQALAKLRCWLIHQESISNLFVRVNGVDHPLSEEERELLSKFPYLGIVLPKVASGRELQAMLSFYRVDSGRKIIPLIESAEGLASLDDIVQSATLHGIGLGMEDFLAHSLFTGTEMNDLIQSVRSIVALAAMRAGIAAIDTISLDLAGGRDLERDVRRAKAAGLTAKFSIHPRQIQPINTAFSPQAAVLARARRISQVLKDADSESGYVRIGDEILSPPTLRKIAHVLAFAQHHKL